MKGLIAILLLMIGLMVLGQSTVNGATYVVAGSYVTPLDAPLVAWAPLHTAVTKRHMRLHRRLWRTAPTAVVTPGVWASPVISYGSVGVLGTVSPPLPQ